jgi:MYXO-CTERM domain-containing protein
VRGRKPSGKPRGGKLRRGITRTVLGAGISMLALPALAAAHVTVQPDEAPAGGFVVLDVRVPNEEESASTAKVAVKFPDGFAEVSFQPVPGWDVEVKKSKLAQPVTTDEGDKLTEQVSQVTWSGGKVAPGEFQDFPVSVQVPDKAGTSLTFKANQTYDNGKVVRWIGPPGGDSPAPQVKVTAAESESASATPTPAAASSGENTDDDDSKALPIIALIVGALGLLAGGAALLSRRRSA